MGTFDDIDAATQAAHLTPVGAFHSGPGYGAPPGSATLVLLGPREPGFRAHLNAAPELRDGIPDPVDRWSTRVIGALADTLGARAVFPFTGPPWPPFIAWATRTGRVWPSPVSLLVHDTMGLMLSIRGALAFDTHIVPPPPRVPRPCATCAAPCATACPVGALGPGGYDTARCHAHLDTAAGHACLTQGCAARRACPISAAYVHDPAQSAHHMATFHPATAPTDRP